MKAWDATLLGQVKNSATAGRSVGWTKRFSAVFFRLFILLLPWLITSCLPPTMTSYQGHKVFNPLFLFYLESSKRDQWQMPEQILDALALHEGSVVADIGAGGGYFTEKLSCRVGASGHVYATDVQDVMLRKLRKRVQKRGLANVSVVHGEFEDPNLPPGKCDWLFFSSVYKEIDERVTYMRTARQALKTGGRVAIIEYRLEAQGPGPPPKYRLPEQRVIAEMEVAGFRLLEHFDFLPREYFLVFGLPDQNPSKQAAIGPNSGGRTMQGIGCPIK